MKNLWILVVLNIMIAYYLVQEFIDIALLNDPLDDTIQTTLFNMNIQILTCLNNPVQTMEIVEVDFGPVQDEVHFQKNFIEK